MNVALDLETIEDRVRRALPAIADEDLAAAFERASDQLLAEAKQIRQFTRSRRD